MSELDRRRAVVDAWLDECHREERDVEEALYDLPEFAHAMESLDRPPYVLGPVMLRCTRGHDVLDVVIERDGNWHMLLSPANDDHTVVATDARWSILGDRADDSHNDISAMRVRISCPDCTYDGVHRGSKLLVHVAVAILFGHRRLPLPA